MSLELTRPMLFALCELVLLESGEHPTRKVGREGPILADLRVTRGTLEALARRKLAVDMDGRYVLTGNGVMVARAFLTGQQLGRGPGRLDLSAYLWGEHLYSETRRAGGGP